MKINKTFYFANRMFIIVATPTVKTEDLNDTLLEKLENGAAHFVYETEKKELREAFGTLNPKLIPSKKAAKTEEMFKLLKEYQEVGTMSHGQWKDLTKFLNDIEAGHKPARSRSEDNQVYWDFDRQAFRSFSKTRLVAVY